jgi:hypothetical protein
LKDFAKIFVFAKIVAKIFVFATIFAKIFVSPRFLRNICFGQDFCEKGNVGTILAKTIFREDGKRQFHFYPIDD